MSRYKKTNGAHYSGLTPRDFAQFDAERRYHNVQREDRNWLSGYERSGARAPANLPARPIERVPGKEFKVPYEPGWERRMHGPDRASAFAPKEVYKHLKRRMPVLTEKYEFLFDVLQGIIEDNAMMPNGMFGPAPNPVPYGFMGSGLEPYIQFKWNCEPFGNALYQSGHFFSLWSGLSDGAQCTGLQSWPNSFPAVGHTWGNITGPYQRTIRFGPKHNTLNRYLNRIGYWLNVPGGVSIPGAVHARANPPLYIIGENPNLTRAMPGDTMIVSPKPVASFTDQMNGWFDETRPFTRQAYQFGPPNGSPPVKVGRPGPPSPPGANEREVPKTKGVGAVFRAAMDVISESAEFVDALYESLPEKTRKKWDCSGSRGLIDSAGQYGIDKADCKMRALWHNTKKIDPVKAIKNIIANEIQDKVIGDLSRMQPKEVGRTTEDGMKAVNDLLDALFEASGLQ